MRRTAAKSLSHTYLALAQTSHGVSAKRNANMVKREAHSTSASLTRACRDVKTYASLGAVTRQDATRHTQKQSC